MGMPKIVGAARKKPLCYDPDRDRFIRYDEIVSGEEEIIPLEQLSKEELKKLVIERQCAGEDYTVQAMSGGPMTRDDVVESIRRDEPFGVVTMEAEVSHLRDLLRQIVEARNQD